MHCSSLDDVQQLLELVRGEVRVSENTIPFFKMEGIRLLDEFKDCFIEVVAGPYMAEAERWVEETQRAVEALVRSMRLAGFTYPREFRSFSENPRAHLRKKIFNYVYDLLRGKMSFDEFARKAGAAIRTSLRTNMRTSYQIWGLTELMKMLADQGYRLAYPEHGFISFDRSGKQKLGIIPPNAVLANMYEGFISLFHEAPRPLGWEDTGDLQRIWSLYTALRPDAMIYSGMVLNMVDMSRSPPIKRPSIILEFKELEDWYNRVRDLKGYFKKPLTAEEWRSMWLEGLFDGLADIMGVRRSEVRQRVEEGKSLKVREHQLVKLYMNMYRPKKLILVSRASVPGDLRKELENEGITVYDDVGFNPEKLRPVAEEARSIASFDGVRYVNLRLDVSIARRLVEAARRLGVDSVEELLKIIVERGIG